MSLSQLFRQGVVGVSAIALTLFTATAWAGPPYATDDPEPVELGHWEMYLASSHFHDKDGWSGTGPHFEVNYGAIRNLQLHLIAPLAYAAPSQGRSAYGYGDTELGVKYRFIQEGTWIPQVGTFPFLEVPTGSQDRGLGNGRTQIFVPLWLQKSFGRWTSYGGAGYWVNSGEHHRSWWYVGWQIQRRLFDGLSVGGELFHTGPRQDDAGQETRFNLGSVVDFSDFHHLLVSAGRGIQGPNTFQLYVAYQITFGPEK